MDIEEETTDILLREPWIRIGWSRCRLKERVEVGRCYRCESINHLAKDCKETPIGEKCRKCGNEGHKAAECQGENVYCWTCKTDDHRNASFKCPRFRDAIRRGDRMRLAYTR